MKFVLHQNSNTQRISVHYKHGTDHKNVLLSKDWKKSFKDKVWNVGKGILVPKDKLIKLGRILETELETKQQLDTLLSDLEKEETIVES